MPCDGQREILFVISIVGFPEEGEDTALDFRYGVGNE
jgi:hypothetical protein